MRRPRKQCCCLHVTQSADDLQPKSKVTGGSATGRGAKQRGRSYLSCVFCLSVHLRDDFSDNMLKLMATRLKFFFSFVFFKHCSAVVNDFFSNNETKQEKVYIWHHRGNRACVIVCRVIQISNRLRLSVKIRGCSVGTEKTFSVFLALRLRAAVIVDSVWLTACVTGTGFVGGPKPTTSTDQSVSRANSLSETFSQSASVTLTFAA